MKFFFSFAGLLVCLIAGAGALAWQLGYFAHLGPPVTFLVQKGENFSSLAHKLKAAGVVKNERALRWYVNLSGSGKGLKRGEFPLFQNMPVPEVVKALTEGKPIEYKVTIPEGYNLYQIADQYAEQKMVADRKLFIDATRNPELIAALPTLTPGERHPKSLEGYLYPDTYLVQRVESPVEMVQSMVHHFKEIYAEVGPQILKSDVVKEFHFTPHQVIVLASIVEKETGAAIERPMIASVFLNRLRRHMRLQTDPTIIYSLYLANGAWDGNISRKDLNAPTAYNTYQMDGLPPGPISNPSKNAIQAVLNPANTDFLYFVSRGNGTHIFSKDYAAHSKAVRDTQLHPKTSQSSWRDLPASQKAK
ncbi:MAG: endolytic transglycosylase MltG [Bdellovibrionota bacterium]